MTVQVGLHSKHDSTYRGDHWILEGDSHLVDQKSHVLVLGNIKNMVQSKWGSPEVTVTLEIPQL